MNEWRLNVHKLPDNNFLYSFQLISHVVSLSYFHYFRNFYPNNTLFRVFCFRCSCELHILRYSHNRINYSSNLMDWMNSRESSFWCSTLYLNRDCTNFLPIRHSYGWNDWNAFMIFLAWKCWLGKYGAWGSWRGINDWLSEWYFWELYSKRMSMESKCWLDSF